MFRICETTSITYQAPGNGVLFGGEHRGHRMAGERGVETVVLASEQGVRNDEQCVDLLFRKTSDGWLELAFGARRDNFDRHPDGIGEWLPEAFVDRVAWILWIAQHAECSCLRHQLAEHFELLREQMATEYCHAGHIAARLAEARNPPGSNRISADQKHDRNRHRCRSGRKR